ncbi:class I SAM-dependent methyltransferase [Altererythrobacter sp. CC-YST694]|uniref:class I SAM-dependent methyltransferase n=1 Tax=Altererythrobacter sp. CC-YST694 TaxID=2755038 RepID=UPI001D00D6B8|nr:class I SAM-dependent methyltransferase [Altererythrobacter sp. CC-YST694]MCB5424613.1 class I SAM-dependent methyltransferase [Altererythrobacter sp. CC-YST694]
MGLRSWYEEAVLPRIIKCACNDARIHELRGHLVPLAQGRVFELGCGGGLNQQFYDPSRVTSFAAIDPSPAMLDGALKAAQEKGWQADIRIGKGEAIPFPDDSFDTVVCTYTMCSVTDQTRVLAEMRRIMAPGGRLLFLEHGRAPEPGVYRAQRMIEPVWKRMMGNCHLTREVRPAVKRTGFEIADSSSLYMSKMPRWAGFMEWGVAVKPGP